ncbi:metallophosphoesterase [Mesorhizobium sp.]|uniref:metallophosphoesterase family protein n=1 Tax=Mesorhizobium sp. TaxID=1871066 RepID=UPI000FE3EDAF|nr:metallophosphoesterase [Mesorhizobium sp.]RWJ03410.1 MAG: serine/threonine protein phosphatase [Mesorhizobium sp.]
MHYGIVSDIHAHKWSTFSTVDPDGVNSRLRIILDELMRAATELQAAGGKTLVIAGDIFHSRGTIDPEVLNPLQDVVRKILDMGIEILMIPGNHDLVGKETTRLGSAIETLSETFSSEGSIRVFNEPHIAVAAAGEVNLAFVPWQTSNEELLKAAGKLAAELRRIGQLHETDLIIHAGIDGVLDGMPDHGLTAGRLADLGFRNVFAGHYHNHKALGGGVYSIGATTHHTWSDVNAKAGFLLVDGDGKVDFYPSRAPSFVDVSGMDEDDIANMAAGNYVRFRGEQMSNEDIKELREFLLASGALGVSIQAPKTAVAARSGTPVKTGLTLEASVTNFIDAAKDIPAHVDREAVKRAAAEILTKARATYEEA